MKKQVIVCGWYFDKFDGKENQTEYIEGLIQLNKREDVDVFYACHNDPPKIIESNFRYERYKNIGLEWGAYDKAWNSLKDELSEDTQLLFIQDDIVIKDWSFVDIVSAALDMGAAVVGNGPAYPWDFDPAEEARLSFWLKTNDTWIDYVKEENKHIYDQKQVTFGVRGSFVALKYKDMVKINGFDYINKPMQMGVKEDGTKFMLIDPFGNTSMYLNGYKFGRILGNNNVKYLGDHYRKSKYMIECGRGMVVTPAEREGKEGKLNIPIEMVLEVIE